MADHFCRIEKIPKLGRNFQRNQLVVYWYLNFIVGLFPLSLFAFFLTLIGSESVSLHFMTKWRSQAAQGREASPPGEDERKRPKGLTPGFGHLTFSLLTLK
jgi:hypothetical protein